MAEIVDHVVAPDRPSYDDLAAEVAELRSRVERLTALLDALETENADLRRRLDGRWR